LLSAATGVPTDAPIVGTDAPVVSTGSPTTNPVVATEAPVIQIDTLVPTGMPSSAPIDPPTFVPSGIPSLQPSLPPLADGETRAPVAVPKQKIRVENYYIAYATNSDQEPTPEQYNEILMRTTDYFEGYFEEFYATRDDVTFLGVESAIKKTLFGQGKSLSLKNVPGQDERLRFSDLLLLSFNY